MQECKGWLAATHYCQFLHRVPCVFCNKKTIESNLMMQGTYHFFSTIFLLLCPSHKSPQTCFSNLIYLNKIKLPINPNFFAILLIQLKYIKSERTQGIKWWLDPFLTKYIIICDLLNNIVIGFGVFSFSTYLL
jgi:hypothetical protein